MTSEQYREFSKLRDEFRDKINKWKEDYPLLIDKIKETSAKEYEIINSFVYNEKLDSIEEKNQIKYIWVTDNPGMKENILNQYGVGQSGNAGKNFMEGFNLVKDFNSEVLILNKSPIHTRVTAELKKLVGFEGVAKESQEFMAYLSYELHRIFNCELWILGTSNMHKIFSSYTNEILSNYSNSPLKSNIYLFYHFSQGQFKKDFNRISKEDVNLKTEDICHKIGIEKRNKILNF